MPPSQFLRSRPLGPCRLPLTRGAREFKDDGTEQDYSPLTSLKGADIRVGAITNHNKFDREEFKALRRQRRRYHLLPVELSVKDGAGSHARDFSAMDRQQEQTTTSTASWA